MTFIDFVTRLQNDPDLVLDLAQKAWQAQAKASALVEDGSLAMSRSQFDQLRQFFAGVDAPEFFFSTWEEATWQ